MPLKNQARAKHRIQAAGFTLCLVLGLMAAPESVPAQALRLVTAPATNLEKFPAAHPLPDKNKPTAQQEASRLTETVAARLPPSSQSRPRIVRRNLVDAELFAAMARDQIPHAPMASDAEFCRRIHLDLIGRIPTPERLQAFLEDRRKNKRDLLIDELLESEAWVDHWAYWYGDLVRNCANRIGNPATQNFDAWIRASFKANKPYNQMVTEMLTATAPSTGWSPDSAPAAFLARWHVPADTMYSDRYEDTADEIIVQSARLFLGINYQCISCHGGKGFLEKVNLDLVSRKRSDFWAMAAFFGKTRVRIVPFQDRFSISEDGTGYDTYSSSSVRLKRQGAEIEPTFMLTGEKADSTRPLRPQFARMLTTHPQFARATVNLVWKQFFGLGIVDPFDSFDLARQNPRSPLPAPWTTQPTNPRLLEKLGEEFARQNYDLKGLMRLLARSSAYQLSSRFDGNWQEAYTPYFARHYVRLLTAEQLHDSICQATGVLGNYRRRDMVFGTPLPDIQFWTQAPTPEEIGHPEAKAFVQIFGQANREQFDRQPGGSILQAMSLMNSPFVTRRVRAEGGTRVEKVLQAGLSDAQVVDQLYLSTLSRWPTPSEKELALSWLQEDRRQGVEDLQWALLNKLDFVFNY